MLQSVLTGNVPEKLGLIGVVQFVPLFALTLITGWTADRLDRRHIARATIALEILCAVILGWTSFQGTVTLPILFGVAALLGVARAFAACTAARAIGCARASGPSRGARCLDTAHAYG